MDYFYHFLAFLGVFALIVAFSLFGMELAPGIVAAALPIG